MMQIDYLKILYMGILAALSAYVVNRNIAVYHDGLRTVIPELIRGEKTRSEISRYSFNISIGFILLYALPYSLATGIIIIHIILLSVDIIATRLHRTIWAVLAGFALGIIAALVIDLFNGFLSILPIDVYPALNALWMPLAYAFPMLPAIAAGYHSGWKPTIVIGASTIAVWVLLEIFLPASFVTGFTVRGIALFVGLILLLLYFGMKEKKTADADKDLFAENIQKIRKNTPILLIIGGLLAVGASRHWLAGEPIQLVLLHKGLISEAALVAFFSAIGFVPLVALSGLVSGVWNQDGYCDWLLGIGYLLPNPILAFIGGVLGMGTELFSLDRINRFLQTRPGVSTAASAMRDAMNIIPELAMVAGGVAAGAILAGPVGIAFVIGCYSINEISHRPAMPMSVPPMAVLLLLLILSVAHYI